MSAKHPPHQGKSGDYRLKKLRQRSLQPRGGRHGDQRQHMPVKNAVVECGWGRLIFSQTFVDLDALTRILREERPEQRDIAFYVHEPHVILSQAPQDLFLDPSHSFRLDLATYRPSRRRFKGFTVRRLCTVADAEAVNRIYEARGMVRVDPSFYWERRDARLLTHFVAEDESSGAIIGTVMGIDHSRAFNDPEHGSSLWCLAVDPQAAQPGIGEALVRRLAEHFQARGAAYMDLSVLHDNTQAIALYEKLGFERVPFFAIKNKNTINERLFLGPRMEQELNPYAAIIINEARRRGIQTTVLDAEAAYFRLTFGGRSVVCRESLTELTTAIAMSRCADKAVTRRLLATADLKVPDQIAAGEAQAMADFLARYGAVVVKPANGEQGRGITVDIDNLDDLETAVARAQRYDSHVLIEQYVAGQDLRVIVIGYKLVAAAVRRPPVVVGDGVHSIADLVARLSRRREAATQGESSIPLDDETIRCVRLAGHDIDDVLDTDQRLAVRKTANLHTGGTIHDVTDRLHPTLVAAAIHAARVIEIPVVGLDFMVSSPQSPDYVIIEANERPGLANHEPQPTAERFIDLLFPHSIPTQVRSIVQSGKPLHEAR
ncbi:MAG: N-acetylglutaminylglutamine synthetase [Sphingomonadales bacterium]